ncbi:MAG: ATP-binding cassette domain-containing protein [Brevinematales bacterium]|nr:ATP-binding cassette domain-containing protein [Brevinematales bacterium]
MKTPNILELKKISFNIGKKPILKNLSLSIKKGEIHSIMGEKDSGKSTLVKILGGFYSAYSYKGNILLDGKPVKFYSQRDSEKSGIGVVYQNSSLIPQLNVYENIFLAKEISFSGIIDWKKSFEKTKELFHSLGFDIFPGKKISELSNWEVQIVKLARALIYDPIIIIFDEITSDLSENEGESFLQVIRQLKLQKNKTVIFISHRTNEIFDISDRVSVLRNGEIITTEDIQVADEDLLIKKMTGRELGNIENGKEILKNLGITEREKEIIDLLLKGYDNKKICEELFISLNTVKTHIYSIYQKTNVKNRMELANLIKDRKSHPKV